MANRGFPQGTEPGKTGFPAQHNGAYPAMYYGQDMSRPYREYSIGPDGVPSFQPDPCSMQPGAPGGPNSQYYNHNYMQQYSPQAMLSYANQAAAYHNAALQNSRLSNPQHIADSIYNMTAQQGMGYHRGPVPPQMANNYSPVPPLSVRTGHSPAAASLNSPAGSTHSVPDRPMPSPHIPPNAGYTYHTNQQVHPQQQQQYYNSPQSMPVMPHDGLDPRGSIERLSAVNSPADRMANHNHELTVPASHIPISPGYQPRTHSHQPMQQRQMQTGGMQRPMQNNSMLLTTNPPIRPPVSEKLSPHSQAPTSVSPAQSHVSSAGATSTAVTTSTAITTSAAITTSTTTPLLSPSMSAVSTPPDTTIRMTSSKPLGEENDLSKPVNENAQESTPHDSKPKTDCQDDDVSEESQELLSDQEPDDSISKSIPMDEESQDNGNVADISSEDADSVKMKSPKLSGMGDSFDSNKSSQSRLVEDENTHLSALKDSHGSNSLSNSFSSSINDESRLPPRKRKQHHISETLSKPTIVSNSADTYKPPKKRGRPTKEMVRLREAAKLAVAKEQQQLMLGTPVFEPIKESKTKKERRPSMSKKEKGSSVHKDRKDSASHTEKTPKLIKEHAENDDGAVFSSEAVISRLPAKSNAVEVSPPKKPKASVSEMQKALMTVISSEGADPDTGKRKRGRPFGSRNKKTKDGRPRSDSYSAVAKSTGDSTPAKAPYNPAAITSSPNETATDSTPLPFTEAYVKLQTKQNRKSKSQVTNKLMPIDTRPSTNKLKSPSVSPKVDTEPHLPTSTAPWRCVFCQHISNFNSMGDLFGGYNIQPGQPLVARNISHKKSSEQQRRRNLSEGSNSTPCNEVWFHEMCIIWAPGVHMLNGKLYGVHDALMATLPTVCTGCKKGGAGLGCYFKGCSQRYHVHCSMSAGCELNDENYSMLCSKHKNKKLTFT